ncbi:MAG TPA: class I SAM-dependent methyltransferase [Miltoncostaeaceae bacterium]|nr:class I SAM-dependent methyltransferase [Miltoncostaeaceae bacterium]
MSTTTTIDEARVERFAGLVVQEAGAALNTALVAIGDRLGLYRAMADGVPVTSAELADATGTHERYVREWLAAQAASGFVDYDAVAGRYALPTEHALVLADDTSPLALAGLFQAAAAAVESGDRVVERFRTGRGLGWGEHDHDLFRGTERVFGATYRSELVASWLPALDGAVERLERGIRVADVGCGHGVSTVLMAEAFPASSFVGYDLHAASIETARARAASFDVADRVRFREAGAADYPGEGYGLICFFDSLHDMGDPVAAARHARRALAPDGVLMVVEPLAGDAVEDNLNPVGRLYYGFSTLVCTPGSLSQPGRAALGTQAGEARLREVLAEGGFGSVRRAAETPFNLVLEARP